MTTHVSTAPRHTHQCSECGRPFYLCSERDCEMAPDTCTGCEMDRQDAFFDQVEMTTDGRQAINLLNRDFPIKES